MKIRSDRRTGLPSRTPVPHQCGTARGISATPRRGFFFRRSLRRSGAWSRLRSGRDPELSMSGGDSVAPMGMGASKCPFRKKGSESRVGLVQAPTWTRNVRTIIIIYRIETFTLLSGPCIFRTTSDSISIWYCVFSPNSLTKHSS